MILKLFGWIKRRFVRGNKKGTKVFDHDNPFLIL
jgi:hypothetical protein